LASEYRKNDALVLNQRKAMEFVERTIEEDGEHIWLTVKFPMQDPDGQLLLGGKSFDITDRHRAEEALRAARRELEARVQERTADLNRANQSLRELSVRLLQMRDEERRRLARELHDSVGQLVAAISMNLARLEARAEMLGQDGAKLLVDTSTLVGQIASEIRTISHLLHPPLLDEVGLISALHWYVDEFSKRSKIETVIESSSDLGRLPADMEIAIFRIVQECLANIHRHSGSKTALIRVEKENQGIKVVAQDSGCGIESDKIAGISEGRGGVGFRGMAERVRYLGGDLAVDSNSVGTVVTAILPLRPTTRTVERPEVA
jgi:signal transduction histidine kinase